MGVSHRRVSHQRIFYARGVLWELEVKMETPEQSTAHRPTNLSLQILIVFACRPVGTYFLTVLACASALNPCRPGRCPLSTDG